MKEAFPRKFTLFYSLHHGAAYGVILGVGVNVSVRSYSELQG